MSTRPSPSVRLLASLLPPTWPDRQAVLDVAARLDRAHDGDGSAILLQAWKHWRATGEAPDQQHVRDLLIALGTLLGGIASELRYRPRHHRRRSESAA